MTKKTTNVETKVATKKSVKVVKKTAKVEAKATKPTAKVEKPKVEVKKPTTKVAKKIDTKTTAKAKVETKTVDKTTLESRVRAVAKSGKCMGMGEWTKSPKNREKKALHVNICKKLAELSDKNGGYPITYLVYFAVGKSAHRTHIFEGGYETFNEKKAKTILSWLKAFAKYNGNDKLVRNANIAHALCAFYEQISSKPKDFNAALAAVTPNPKFKTFKEAFKALGGTVKGDE